MKRELFVVFLGVLFFIFIFFIGFYFGLKTEAEKYKFKNQNDKILLNNKENIKNKIINSDIVKNLCFFNEILPNEENPYKVEQFLEISIFGNNVFGTKRGSQIGPDMNNGFWGEIEGEFKDGKIEVLFSYEIEGFLSKEKEMYYFDSEKNLVKEHFELEEKNGILIPILSKKVNEIIFYKKVCN